MLELGGRVSSSERSILKLSALPVLDVGLFPAHGNQELKMLVSPLSRDWFAALQ